MVIGWRESVGSMLVHRTVGTPFASVFPQVRFSPCGCPRYPVLLTHGKEFDGFGVVIRLAPLVVRGGRDAGSVFPLCLALAWLVWPTGSWLVLSDMEC